jgi:2'-5' RNA ligase
VPTLAGIFILGELDGPVADEIQAVIERHDPKLAKYRRPHVTLTGSSGAGPIAATTPVPELRARLAPIAAATAPISVLLGHPHRFMQTDIVVLPIDPHGPIRELHDKLATSGLHFGAARFNFSPHVTLNLYRTLTPKSLRELMRVRITAPVTIHTLHIYRTQEPNPARMILELPLQGGTAHERVTPNAVMPSRP